MKMSECKYCGGDCPEQVDKNGKARAGFICNGYAVGGMYRESTITTIFKGEFVQVDMVDETIELTVENNVYSRSESLELLEEMRRACSVSRIAESMVGMREIENTTYSKQMQDELEPIIEEPLDSKANLYDKIGIMSSGYLPRLIKEMEDE
tara:strand:- start:103 stop:555 length:453 start_codon:yes stop_codon:yes gene_type:complete